MFQPLRCNSADRCQTQKGLSDLVFPSWLCFRPKAKHVRLVAVGIGRHEKFQGQLKEIAGENVYTSSNFDELSDLMDDILAETCSKLAEAIFSDTQQRFFHNF